MSTILPLVHPKPDATEFIDILMGRKPQVRTPLVEYLVDDVGIDGKHSYENNIIPVNEFQTRYHGRLAVLGGLDLNILGAASPEEVRVQTRHLIETCGARGRYAGGSGNSIPSYIPPQNYLAMVDEAVRAVTP